MKILITGATGFIGKKLVERFLVGGHEVNILTRDKEKTQSLFKSSAVKAFTWNDFTHPPEKQCFEGISGVIHLMGENIAAKRWSHKQKKILASSRVDSTHSLGKAIQALSTPLDFFISAGAIGIYPVNTSFVLDEASPVGHTFLANLCKDWEKSVFSLDNVRRKIILRTGVVLDRDGGALEKMLPPFKFGMGGPIGDGNQIMSWIHREDLVELYYRCAVDQSMDCIYNAVAPHSIDNFHFTKELGKALHRPTLIPVPVFPLKLALGEMAGVILDSQNVSPKRLLENQFIFKYPDISSCFKAIFHAEHS